MPVVSIARHALPPHSAVGGLESTPVAIGVYTCCTCARRPGAGTSRGSRGNPLVPTSVPTSSNLATHLPAMQAPLAARHPGRLRHCEPAPARFQAERRARPSVKGSRCSCRSRAQAVGTPPNARPQGPLQRSRPWAMAQEVVPKRVAAALLMLEAAVDAFTPSLEPTPAVSKGPLTSSVQPGQACAETCLS